MGRLEVAGYKGWWPMKKIVGRDEQGNFKYQEVFVNMARSREGKVCTRKFETYTPENGWNGEPPYPTGEKSTSWQVSEAYRRNYDLIRWEKENEG
jgi:hypothetical protein